MKISFKDFNQFVDLGDETSDEQLTEIFGFFKNQTKLDQAKKKRQELEKKFGKEMGAKQYALRQKQKNLAWAKAKSAAEQPPKISKDDRSAAGGRAAERDWVQSMMATEDHKSDDTPIEVHGVMGNQSKPFRKKFKNQAAFEKWLDDNEGNVEVYGYRDLEESAIVEAAASNASFFPVTYKLPTTSLARKMAAEFKRDSIKVKVDGKNITFSDPKYSQAYRIVKNTAAVYNAEKVSSQVSEASSEKYYVLDRNFKVVGNGYNSLSGAKAAAGREEDRSGFIVTVVAVKDGKVRQTWQFKDSAQDYSPVDIGYVGKSASHLGIRD